MNMPNNQTELVIRISASDSVSRPKNQAEHERENNLISELKQCLHPGAVILLTYRQYVAMTCIEWLSEPQEDASFQAGVRFLGVSLLPQRESLETPKAPAPPNAPPTLTLSAR